MFIFRVTNKTNLYGINIVAWPHYEKSHPQKGSTLKGNTVLFDGDVKWVPTEGRVSCLGSPRGPSNPGNKTASQTVISELSFESAWFKKPEAKDCHLVLRCARKLFLMSSIALSRDEVHAQRKRSEKHAVKSPIQQL